MKHFNYLESELADARAERERIISEILSEHSGRTAAPERGPWAEAAAGVERWSVVLAVCVAVAFVVLLIARNVGLI